MRAGKLTDLIVIERRAVIVNEDAAKITVWTPVLKTRAQIISSDARAFLAEAGEETESGIVFRVRYHPAIRPGDRIIHEDREFDLAEIKTIVARRVLELRATGGAS